MTTEFTITAPDGNVLRMSGSKPPSEAQVRNIIAEYERRQGSTQSFTPKQDLSKQKRQTQKPVSQDDIRSQRMVEDMYTQRRQTDASYRSTENKLNTKAGVKTIAQKREAVKNMHQAYNKNPSAIDWDKMPDSTINEAYAAYKDETVRKINRAKENEKRFPDQAARVVLNVASLGNAPRKNSELLPDSFAAGKNPVSELKKDAAKTAVHGATTIGLLASGAPLAAGGKAVAAKMANPATQKIAYGAIQRGIPIVGRTTVLSGGRFADSKISGKSTGEALGDAGITAASTALIDSLITGGGQIIAKSPTAQKIGKEIGKKVVEPTVNTLKKATGKVGEFLTGVPAEHYVYKLSHPNIPNLRNDSLRRSELNVSRKIKEALDKTSEHYISDKGRLVQSYRTNPERVISTKPYIKKLEEELVLADSVGGRLSRIEPAEKQSIKNLIKQLKKLDKITQEEALFLRDMAGKNTNFNYKIGKDNSEKIDSIYKGLRYSIKEDLQQDARQKAVDANLREIIELGKELNKKFDTPGKGQVAIKNLKNNPELQDMLKELNLHAQPEYKFIDDLTALKTGESFAKVFPNLGNNPGYTTLKTVFGTKFLPVLLKNPWAASAVLASSSPIVHSGVISGGANLSRGIGEIAKNKLARQLAYTKFLKTIGDKSVEAVNKTSKK